MKGWRGNLVKFAFVAALMALVFSTVQWRDHLVWRQGKNELRTDIVTIVGKWDTPTITVERDGVGDSVTPGPQPDGTELDVLPGFWTYWVNVDAVLFGLGAFCYFLTVLIAGSRWWWLLRVNGMDVSLLEALRFTWIGVFFNTVVPGATGGDVIKAVYIMRRCPGHRVPALVSVIVDRVLGMASLAILGAIVVLFALDDGFGEIAIAIWAVIAGLSLLAAIAFSRRLRNLVRLRSLLDKLPSKLSHLLKLFDQAVYFYRGHKNVIVASLVAGIGNHVVSVMSVVLIGDALGVDLPWVAYFVLIPVINIISAVPLMPNGWGLGEFLYQKLFATYGAGYLEGTANAARVMGTRGVALSVLYRLHQTLWSLLGGVFVLVGKDRLTKAEIEQEVAREEAEEHDAPGLDDGDAPQGRP